MEIAPVLVLIWMGFAGAIAALMTNWLPKAMLMAPVSFMQRPLTWLGAISRYGAEFATAPNFAFDLCVDRVRPDQMAGIDLSGYRGRPVTAELLREVTDAMMGAVRELLGEVRGEQPPATFWRQDTARRRVP